MLLRNLKIEDLNGEIIRDIKFHSGANFVVDKEISEEHNNVGKTTLLRLIDIALGAKERSYVYKNFQTQSEEKALKEYIENKKINIKLEISKDFSDNASKKVLEVGLYRRANYKINGEKFSQKKYRTKLNEIFFNNDFEKPSFRQLIKSFVRISMHGDENTFLHNLGQMTTKTTYRQVYDYLFNIDSPVLTIELEKVNRELKSTINAEKQFKNVNNERSIESIDQKLFILKRKNAEIINNINNIVSEKYFFENQNKIKNLRDDYTKLTSEINDLEFKLKINSNALEDLYNDKNKLDKNITKDFFDEVKELIPDINKNYNDLLIFNSELKKNKEQYLNTIVKDLELKIKDLLKKRDNLLSGNKNLIALVKNNEIDNYLALLKESAKIESQIGEKESIRDSLFKYNAQINKLKKDFLRLNKKKSEIISYVGEMSIFNEKFTNYSKQINNEEAVLSYNPNPDEFPLSIDNISAESTGTIKSLVSAYDLAYQQFAKEQNKVIPNFVIHDVIENIESENLAKVISIANDNNIQYIAAILREDFEMATNSLNLNNNEKQKLMIVELSKKEKLFKV